MAPKKKIAESEIDDLYRLALSEFTAARNALAKELRGRGERDGAERVKKLGKPSVSAWLVNQLFYEQRSSFDALLDAAAKQHRAVARGASMSTRAGDDRRTALRDLLESARLRAEAGGAGWTPALRQRVTHTLEALAAGGPDQEPHPGRLSTDLEPPGFDALLGTTLTSPKTRPAKPSRAPAPEPARPSAAARRRLEAARARQLSARRDLTGARRARTAARKTLERAESRAVQAERRARAAELKAERTRADAHARDVERRKARSAVDEAERAVVRAESKLQAESRTLAEGK